MGVKRIVVGIVTSTVTAGALAAGAIAAPSTVIHDMMKQSADKDAVVNSVVTSQTGSSVIHDM